MAIRTGGRTCVWPFNRRATPSARACVRRGRRAAARRRPVGLAAARLSLPEKRYTRKAKKESGRRRRLVSELPNAEVVRERFDLRSEVCSGARGPRPLTPAPAAHPGRRRRRAGVSSAPRGPLLVTKISYASLIKPVS
ncbi:hypothetical protein EVAR_76282_1 [Eumeta japonica]|uniref:Uncharacterized protein n=1 Tax=Eumeta variegata TaxID=151549 RepID=A0A4C1UQ57_EUMVA|nr:hypothetical protein EVAR_76282_1 [Eumeta japonica]